MRCAKGEFRSEPESPTGYKRGDSGFSNHSETGNLGDLPETEAVTPGLPEALLNVFSIEPFLQDPQSILTRSQEVAVSPVQGRASSYSTASEVKPRQHPRMSSRSAFSFTSFRSSNSKNTSRSRSGFTDASERTDQSSPDSLLHAARSE